MEFSGVTNKSFTNTIDDDQKVVQALELLDEYWFFENLFHTRPPCMFMSTTDLWNSIQKMGIEKQKDAKKSSSTPASISKEDGSLFVHHQNLLRTPSLPPLIGRERAGQEKEVIPRSNKLSRRASLSSSKIIPQLRGSEVLYYNQQYSDSLYHLSNNIQELVLENKGASGSSTPINSSKDSSPVHHNMLKPASKLTRQASLSSSKIMPQVRCPEVLYYNQHSSDPLYHSSNSIQEMGASGSSTPINSSKESSPVRHNLLRTPSLPSQREEKEIFRKLTRQASLSSAGVSPPIHIPKVGLQPTTRISPAIPRHRTRKEPKIESIMKDNKNPPWEVIRRSLSYKKSSSSKIDLEVEEVQGFKDLGFVFDKEEINKSLANIIPGLQEKKQVLDHEDADNQDEKNKTRRPYLSEAWLVQPSKPAVPNWVDRRSSGEMKEQLKFWARAVASNVRQEC